MIEPIVIRDGDRPTHVVIPWKEWLLVKEALEDRADAEHALMVLADPTTEWTPLEIVERVLAGEHPVKVWREHRDLSQAALALRAGLPQPTVARIETGKRKGTVAQLRALAAGLDVGLETLLAGMA